MNDIIKSESSFSFHLDGENSIDAFSLATIIGNMAELTAIAVHEDEPEANVNVKVTALKQGSFVIDFSTICGIVNTLLSNTPDIVSTAANAIETITGFFKLRKLLNGKLPKQIQPINDNKICVTNETGENLVINKSSGLILNNPHTEALTQNISITVYANDNAKGFSIDTTESSVHFDNEDLLKMNKPIPIIDNYTQQISVIRTDLLIKKPDILGHSAWAFRYNGKNIEARINDDDFYEYIQEGDFTIQHGCYITADLEIAIDLNVSGFPDDKPPKYTVRKVYGGIKNPADTMPQLI